VRTGEMADFQIDPLVKKHWEEIQKRHEVPVNAIGVKIDPRDQTTLTVWKALEINKFIKR
jgi:hypothetical protein